MLVIIPTYNESATVGALIKGVLSSAVHTEVLVVDDGSRDGTEEVVLAARERHPGRVHILRRRGRRGLGSAYTSAFEWALSRPYRAVAQMDGDLSHDPSYLSPMTGMLGTHDCVIGSRYVPGGGVRGWSLYRRLVSMAGNAYAMAVLGPDIHDYTGGYNLWRREALERIGVRSLRCEGYAFQIELKYRALRARLRCAEFPIVFTGRRLGASKLSRSTVAEAVAAVWRLRLTRAGTIGS